MPGLPQLVVVKDNGVERERITGISARKDESLVGSNDRDARTNDNASILVDRADWTSIEPNLNKVTDRFVIEDASNTRFFAGRYVNDKRDDNDVRVLIDSYERDAIDAEPTGGNLFFNNVNDDAVFQDAIDAIPTLTSGTKQTGAASVSFSFAHAERSKQIYDAAKPDGQDVVYNYDRTVDFLDRRGSDKSGSITLSSPNQNIVNTLSVADNTRDPVTHIRGLGAQQGDTQVTAEAIISSYSQGDRQVWREYSNKDIVKKDRLQTIVDRLADQYNSERRRITVEAGLVDVDVALGDSVQVTLSEHDIDRKMRIARLRTVIDSGPTEYTATLTNRKPERGGARKQRDDLQRFNTGYQGFVDRDNDSYGWQPATSSDNATRPYEYPSDVVAEKKAEVLVNSIPYRAYSSGAESGGTTLTDDNTTYGKVEDRANTGNLSSASAGQWVSAGQFTPSVNTSEVWTYTDISVNVGSSSTTMQARVVDNGNNDFIPDSNGLEYNLGSDRTAYVQAIFGAPGNHNGDTLELELQFDNGVSYLYDNRWNAFGPHDHTLAQHTHQPEPGLIEFGGETVSNADLIVNGNTIATNIGSGSFDTSVDISGQLSAGTNTVELSSDSLGLVNLTVVTELFRSGE